eukprot:TRINITY_DN18418_c0_g1_i2.p1 TRINITY_DN18418_c0_g1~~TRINITY_DN18418_c0_g1_i2.p1  ORF type:complete len:476 (+),score=62.02 TRINITY_DN18418_c0_g1_i2:67-1494(+)
MKLNMQSPMKAVLCAIQRIWLYYRCLWCVFRHNGSHEEYDKLREYCGAPQEPFWSKYEKVSSKMTDREMTALLSAIYFHTIGLTFKLWSVPHYRAEHLQEDLINNFSNIAIPGTGIPASLLCYHRYILWAYFITVHPLLTLVAAFNISSSPAHANNRDMLTIFGDELVAPGHWFLYWRINSTLVAAHYTENMSNQDSRIRDAVSSQYQYENKWKLIELGTKLRENKAFSNIKLTPVFGDEMPEIVCKHKNIEGGMGVHIFKNATSGGDWILQERLHNAPEIQRILPSSAPLSTYRVITMSDPTAESFETRHVAITTVFRAGRAGKDTDHSSVLMPVDADNQKLEPGCMFRNWYQVGKPGSNPLSTKDVSVHPDTKNELVGVHLPSSKLAASMCEEAHRRIMPSVPAVGWDVAIASDHGALILEANISCNLFGGSYDKHQYLRILDTYFANRCVGTPADASAEEYSSTAGLTSASF